MCAGHVLQEIWPGLTALSHDSAKAGSRICFVSQRYRRSGQPLNPMVIDRTIRTLPAHHAAFAAMRNGPRLEHFSRQLCTSEVDVSNATGHPPWQGLSPATPSRNPSLLDRTLDPPLPSVVLGLEAGERLVHLPRTTTPVRVKITHDVTTA